MDDTGSFTSILECFLMIVTALILSLILAILGFFVNFWFFIGTGLILFIIFVYLPLSKVSNKLDDEIEKNKMRNRIRDLR
jgi:type IV secretory pathway TrbD component